MEIENNQACFVRLWLRLERTRRMLRVQCKRFCIRNIMKMWFDHEATDDLIWEVCNKIDIDDQTICGWDELPRPALYPRWHRELLRAIVATRLGIGMRKVHLPELDAAYSLAFPKSTPINVNKKKRCATPLQCYSSKYNQQQDHE